MDSEVEKARPSVTLTQGTVVGVLLTEDIPRPVEAFRGIPYALPPTGDRRFRPAEKVRPSTETIDASKFGAVAPGKQLFRGGPKFEYSEDCLTANVFRPPRTSSSSSSAQDEQPSSKALLPVGVYIHGGAFNRGTAMMHNTASFLANSEQDLVVVSFNYRIGALGFLPSTMSYDEGALNLGLKDQLLLLEWVRDNIAAFGGDPNNVTLFGISAGAHSIGHLLMHDEGQDEHPLFHKVILESGAPTSRAVRPYSAPIHEAQFSDFLAETGCPAGLSAAETFAYLRAAPTETIQAAQIAVFDKYNPSLRWAFQPVIDGDVIPRAPMESWRLDRWRKVPIMTGFNRNEGSIYISKAVSASKHFTAFFADLLPLLSGEDIATIDALYPDPLKFPDTSPYAEHLEGTGAQFRRLEVAYGQYAYVAPVRQTAELAVKAAPELPVYVYQWGLESSLRDRARHGENMYYETCEPSRTRISPALRELCLTYNAYIVSFIVSGDPNAEKGAAPGRPRWEPYRAEEPKAMVFGEENKELIGGPAGPPARLCDDTWARKECEFWWSKVDVSQQ